MGCKTAGELLDELDGRSSAARAPSSSDELGGVIFMCRCVVYAIASRTLEAGLLKKNTKNKIDFAHFPFFFPIPHLKKEGGEEVNDGLSTSSSAYISGSELGGSHFDNQRQRVITSPIVRATLERPVQCSVAQLPAARRTTQICPPALFSLFLSAHLAVETPSTRTCRTASSG